jgi:formate/nitrite transporter FocA (FNT family)
MAAKGSRPAPGRAEPEIEEAFDRLLEEGSNRLERPTLSLLATGLLGGIDLGVGVFAYLFVMQHTGDTALAALAFSIGFIALVLARSELFTENFLVPVTAAVAERSWAKLMRLWLVTLAMNLAGGLLFMSITLAARPDLGHVAVTAGHHYATLGVHWSTFWLAVLAGTVITLMTRMQHATDQLQVKVLAGIVMPFVLVGGQLFHSVVDSLFMFAGLSTGSASYGWLDWLSALGWSALGNMVGGVALVTGIRMLRVSHRVADERRRGDADDD